MSEDTTQSSLAGTYLQFRLAGECYGLPILQTREIIGLDPVTRVPGTPKWLCGVLNLRGRVIPIMDLRTRLALPTADATEQTVIIIVEPPSPHPATLGIVVDEVQEVLLFQEHEIEAPPSTMSGQKLIVGLAAPNESVLTLLLDVTALTSLGNQPHLETTRP